MRIFVIMANHELRVSRKSHLRDQAQPPPTCPHKWICTHQKSVRYRTSPVKGTVSRDFLLQVFFMNHLPPSSVESGVIIIHMYIRVVV